MIIMSITNEEKEMLFKEFEARLNKTKKPQGYASGYATIHNLEPAKNYFWSKYDQMTEKFKFDIWSPYGIMSSDWDKIRILVCHIFGVSVVKEIPSDKLNEANNIAKQMIDVMFDENYKTLKEKETETR
jgi:hypothetical protein